MDVKSYRDLIAWQKGMDLVCTTYAITRLLPEEEKFGLISQMRRSAISVPSNIAEGWGRQMGAEYSRFLHIARGSLFELATQGEACMRLGYHADWQAFLEACAECGRIINGLINSLSSRRAAARP